MKNSSSPFFFLQAFSPVSSTGSEPQLRFGRIGLERGLSQSTVFVTYQDSQGYLWFGTEDGLNKYNGYNFDVYKFDPTDSASISNNIVRCIQEDKDGDLWIGTDNGLNRYNRHNGSFTRFLHDPSNARSLVTILFPVSSRTKRASSGSAPPTD